MAITPASHTAIAADALRNLVASSQTFRDLMTEFHGTADTELAAKDHVYFGESTDDVDKLTGKMTDPRPRGIVEWATESQHNESTSNFRASGSLALTLEFPLPDAAAFEALGGELGNPIDENMWFANMYGAVLLEMRENLYTAQHKYLQAVDIDLEFVPFKVRYETTGITEDIDGVPVDVQIGPYFVIVYLFRFF